MKPRAARRPPPRDEHELRVRAISLAGATLAEVAAALGAGVLGGGAHTKGKAGELVERALGADGAPGAVHDFAALGYELKTVPVDAGGRPHESTFVCAVRVAEADSASWSTSWARKKLARVVFVPIIGSPRASWAERVVGAPVFYSPTAEQEQLLAADFDDLMGAIGAGRIEEIDARRGRWLQLRPKAADGRARTFAYGLEGEPIPTVPRGFYLRARFVGAILKDPAAMPP